MWPLFAQLAVPGPEEVASGISRHGLFWIIGLLVSVVAALFGVVMTVQQKRLTDLRESHTEVKALAKEMQAVVTENAKQLLVFSRALDEWRATKRRVPAAAPPPKEGTG